MIRINCSIIAEDEERRRAVIAAATELVELSLHDEGCIAYDLYGSLTSTDRLMIVETWKDEACLARHMASDHFKRLVPEMESKGTLTLEKFDF